MKTRVGAFDPEARTVTVTFTRDGIRHRRQVNAVLDEAGALDAQATRARIADVALGVAAKMDAGLIR